MEYPEYLQLIAWTAVQMMGSTVKVMVLPGPDNTFDVLLRLPPDRRQATFQLRVPWSASEADPEELTAFVREAVLKWQLEYLSTG